MFVEILVILNIFLQDISSQIVHGFLTFNIARECVGRNTLTDSGILDIMGRFRPVSTCMNFS